MNVFQGHMPATDRCIATVLNGHDETTAEAANEMLKARDGHTK